MENKDYQQLFCKLLLLANHTLGVPIWKLFKIKVLCSPPSDTSLKSCTVWHPHGCGADYEDELLFKVHIHNHTHTHRYKGINTFCAVKCLSRCRFVMSELK